MRALPRNFYARKPEVVAREMVGKLLVRETSASLCGGMIVECEAYLSCRDPACHASRGMTRRNVSMFGPPGHAYVYTIHTRWLLNAVTEPEGTPSAILIRAIEPLWGIELMQQRRGTEVLRDLARGPGRLAQALAIDRTYDGWDLTVGKELWIAESTSEVPCATQNTATHTASTATLAGVTRLLAENTAARPLKIVRSGRIGISAAKHRLLRFYLAGNRFVSGRTRPKSPRR